MINSLFRNFLMLFCCVLLGGSLMAADFFKSDKADPDLPADKLYPQGKLFPFSGYSPSNISGFKRLGFTAAGPTYGTTQAKLALAAQKEGIGNLWQLTPVYDKVRLNSKSALAKAAKAAGKKGLDWAKMDACVQKAVKDAIKVSKNNISYWALAVEEIRWWNKNELKYLEVAYKAVKAADPEKRPMFVYMPGHYGYSGMRNYVPHMDLLAQGYYPRFGNRAGFRYWCENVQKTVEGFKPDRPMIAVTEMFVEPPNDQEHALINAYVRHDVWMALIHGFKGIIVFSFGSRRNFDSHGEYLFAYSVVARELTCGENPLGQVVLFGEDKKDITLSVTEGEKTVSVKRKVKKKDVTYTYPTLKWRDMIHHSGRYCFAASSSKTPVKALLKGLPKQPVTVINAADGSVMGKTSDGTFKLEFGAHGVHLLKFVAE